MVFLIDLLKIEKMLKTLDVFSFSFFCHAAILKTRDLK